jgi:hypothetical protein
MRTTAFVTVLLASFALSACASGPTFDPPSRDLTPITWRGRSPYVVPSQVLPASDTTAAQRESLRRVPHGAGRLVNGQM